MTMVVVLLYRINRVIENILSPSHFNVFANRFDQLKVIIKHKNDVSNNC